MIELLLVHALADYPLQGDFLAKAKNKFTPIAGIPFYWALFFHSMIHAGGVYLVTQSVLAFWIELISHITIDHLKCKGLYGFTMDQCLHIAVLLFIFTIV